jgi:hypothetical protein
VVHRFRADGVQTKIEVTPVLHGCVYEPQLRGVAAVVEVGFAKMQIVSFADLYAGKLVAALDRQHPRDLVNIASRHNRRISWCGRPACLSRVG